MPQPPTPKDGWPSSGRKEAITPKMVVGHGSITPTPACAMPSTPTGAAAETMGLNRNLAGEIFGDWCYGKESSEMYRITNERGRIMYREKLAASDVELEGELVEGPVWLEAELFQKGLDPSNLVGSVRLRLVGSRLESNFKARGESIWGDDMLAHRCKAAPKAPFDIPARVMPSTPIAAPSEKVPLSETLDVGEHVGTPKAALPLEIPLTPKGAPSDTGQPEVPRERQSYSVERQASSEEGRSEDGHSEDRKRVANFAEEHIVEQLSDVDEQDECGSQTTQPAMPMHSVRSWIHDPAGKILKALVRNSISDPNSSKYVPRFRKTWASRESTSSYIPTMTEQAENTVAEIDPIGAALQHALELNQRMASDDPAIQEEESMFGLVLDEQYLSDLQDDHTEQDSIQKWARFDVVFGAFVVCNGVLEGLANEGMWDTDSVGVFLLQSGFTLVFIVEWLLRWRHGGFGIQGMINDKWTFIDFLIVSISVLDLWILKLLGASTGSSMSVLRVLRLLRLSRLLRMVQVLRLVWVLVSALVHSVHSLLWCVCLLLVVSYVFALLCFDTIGNSDSMKGDAKVDKYWGGIRRSMLTLVQISTFDGAGDIIRTVTEGKHQKRWLILLMLPCIGLCALGIFNLMLGVMLTSSLEVTSADDKYRHATQMLQNHRALMKLRSLLRHMSPRQVGGDPYNPAIFRVWLFGCLQYDPVNDDGAIERAVSGHSIDASGHDVLLTEGHVQYLMMKAGLTEEEMQAICSEIHSLHGNHNHPIDVDHFILGAMYMQADIHPLQLTAVVSAMKSMAERIDSLDEHMGAVESVLADAIADAAQWVNLPSQSRQKTGPHPCDSNESSVDTAAATHHHHHGNLTAADRMVLVMDKMAKDKARKWARFDAIFTFFVLLNGAAIGLDASKKDQFQRNVFSSDVQSADFVWVFFEFCFVAIFTLEFVLRAVMWYQFEKLCEFKTFMVIFPQMLFRLDISLAMSITGIIPEMCQDAYIAFDALLISFAIVDNFILRFFFANVKYLLLLRLFRSLRMLRLARLLYLFHDLTALVESMYTSGPVVMWSMLLLFCYLYMVGVFLSSTIQSCAKDSDALRSKWADLADTIFNLYKITTFSDWGDASIQLSYECGWWLYFFLLAFVVFFAGLGIVNLVTGVVVQGAFVVVHDNAEEQFKTTLCEIKRILTSSVSKMFADLYAQERDREGARRIAAKLRMRNYLQLWKIVHFQSLVEKAEKLGRPGPKGFADVDAQVHAPACRSTRDLTDPNSNARKFVPQGGPQAIEDIIEAIFDDWYESSALQSRPIDPDRISARELHLLMKDQALAQVLRRVEIDKDGILMLFQRLDTMNIGTVGTEDFIEGVQRMKAPVQGIDVASAKSVLRRLHGQVQDLEHQALLCCDRFLEVATMLRGITPFGTGGLSWDEENVDADIDHHRTEHLTHLHVSRTNMRLRSKVKSLDARLRREARALQESGDVYAFSSVGLHLPIHEAALTADHELTMTSADDFCD